MAKYAITYEETLARTYIVEADNYEDAYNIIYDATTDADIVLDADDFKEWDIFGNEADAYQIESFPKYTPKN